MGERDARKAGQDGLVIKGFDMSKRSWEAFKAPESQYCGYHVEVKGEPDIVADVYDLEGDGGESAARLIAAAPDMLHGHWKRLNAACKPRYVWRIALAGD